MASLIIVDIDQFTIIQSVSFTRDLGNELRKYGYLHYCVNKGISCIPREVYNIKVEGLNIYGLSRAVVNINIINIRTLLYLVVEDIIIQHELIVNRFKLPSKTRYNFRLKNHITYINTDSSNLLFLIRGYYFS